MFALPTLTLLPLVCVMNTQRSKATDRQIVSEQKKKNGTDAAQARIIETNYIRSIRSDAHLNTEQQHLEQEYLKNDRKKC